MTNKTLAFQVEEAYRDGYERGIREIEGALEKVKTFEKFLETDPTFIFTKAIGEFLRTQR